jgi:hypothetical protein
MYVQATPLFTPEDEVASAYFRNHVDDLNATTGNALVVSLPETVAAGNSKDVSKAVDSKRFPGLKRQHLPCVWLEFKGGHAVIALPRAQDEIVKLFRVLADEASAATSAKDLRERLATEQWKARGSMADGDLKGSWWPVIVLTLILVGLLVFLVWEVPRLYDYGFRFPMFLLYAIVALVASVALFGALRSVGRARGSFLGVTFEFGGPAALFIVTVLLGLHSTAEEFTAKFYVRDATTGQLVKGGHVQVELESPITIPLNGGYGAYPGIPGAFLGKPETVDVVADGFAPLTSTVKLSETPVIIRVRPAATTSANTMLAFLPIGQPYDFGTTGVHAKFYDYENGAHLVITQPNGEEIRSVVNVGSVFTVRGSQATYRLRVNSVQPNGLNVALEPL